MGNQLHCFVFGDLKKRNRSKRLIDSQSCKSTFSFQNIPHSDSASLILLQQNIFKVPFELINLPHFKTAYS